MSPGGADEDGIRPKRTERTGNGKLERRMEKLEGGGGLESLESCVGKGGWKDRNMGDQNRKIREQNGKAGEQVGKVWRAAPEREEKKSRMKV